LGLILQSTTRGISSVILLVRVMFLLLGISGTSVSYSAPVVSSPTVPAPAAPAPAQVTKPILDQAYTAAKNRDWKKAAKDFESARVEKPLDYRSLLALAFAYRQLEECPKAIGPLKEMQQRANRKSLNPKEKKLIRHGLFLLARCYAKGNDAGRTLYILNGYLLDPRKFTSELRQSLHLIEFGGLRTQSDFHDYEKAARKALSKIGASSEAPSSPEANDMGGGSLWDETKQPSGSTGGSGF
jgi:hypothetical protein